MARAIDCIPWTIGLLDLIDVADVGRIIALVYVAVAAAVENKDLRILFPDYTQVSVFRQLRPT